VFITIAVHLCAGALAFGLARRGAVPLAGRSAGPGTGWLSPGPGGDSPAAGRRPSLPGKAMVTARTLLAKSRTGARHITKFYGVPGPNYLRDAG
jgi:hypothetical protein